MSNDLPAHELNGPAAAIQIEAEERKLGVALPRSLAAFLRQHNGGSLFGGVAELYGVGDVYYALAEENADLADTTDWPPGFIAFATDGGLGLFAFDSTGRDESGESALYYWTWEERTPERVGSSFGDWLAHLEKIAPDRLRGD